MFPCFVVSRFFYSSRALGARRRQWSLTVVMTGDIFSVLSEMGENENGTNK